MYERRFSKDEEEFSIFNDLANLLTTWEGNSFIFKIVQNILEFPNIIIICNSLEKKEYSVVKGYSLLS